MPGAGGPEGKDANTIPVSLPSLMVTLEEEDLWEEVAEEEVEEVRLRLDLLDDIGSGVLVKLFTTQFLDHCKASII